MEIPYTVTARPDTGLWNAKIGIWLFLASEVMLFGGLFSSYVFLRIGADFHWPVGELKIAPGLLNTANLIISSVTVVFAWASLKMRQYRRYQMFMCITLVCAVIFMVIKGFEYKGKLTHYGIKLDDGTVIEGHVHSRHSEGAGDHGGHGHPGDAIDYDNVTAINLAFFESELGYLEDSVVGGLEALTGAQYKDAAGNVVPLTQDWIDEQRKLAKAWYDLSPEEQKNSPKRVGARLEITSEPLKLSFKQKRTRNWTPTEVLFKDGTRFEGKLTNSTIHFAVDRIDLQYLDVAKMQDSMAFKLLGADYFDRFEENRKEELALYNEEYPGEDPLENAEYLSYAHRLKLEKIGDDYPVIDVPRENVRWFSNFGPAYNPYYAIYFTMTGLHGLHVIGGALVMLQMLVFGRKIYEKNPEHLCNRIEVAGLFWHFVDLVWIFLFPIFYLL